MLACVCCGCGVANPHPGLVKLFGYTMTPDARVGIVSERTYGTLQDYLVSAVQTLSMTTVLDVASQVSSGLRWLHSVGDSFRLPSCSQCAHSITGTVIWVHCDRLL
jgi:hypothetical protein